MLRSWLGDWIGTFLGELNGITHRIPAHNRMQATKVPSGRPRSPSTLHELSPAVPISQREWLCSLGRVCDQPVSFRKIWDCVSGEALHTFAHNHIVRSVALSPQPKPQYLLTVSHHFYHHVQMCR